MNFRQKKHVHAEVQAGALSDILFFLMLFFLIVSTLASPNAIRLLLPQAQSVKSIPSQVITVSITGDLKYYINQNEVTIDNMEQVLTAEAAKHDKPSVVLRMEKTISVADMVKVVDIVNRAKVPIVIAVDKAKAN